jgi:hypothetical protein
MTDSLKELNDMATKFAGNNHNKPSEHGNEALLATSSGGASRETGDEKPPMREVKPLNPSYEYLLRLDDVLLKAQLASAIVQLMRDCVIRQGVIGDGKDVYFVAVDADVGAEIQDRVHEHLPDHELLFAELPPCASLRLHEWSLGPMLGVDVTLPQYRLDRPFYII